MRLHTSRNADGVVGAVNTHNPGEPFATLTFGGRGGPYLTSSDPAELRELAAVAARVAGDLEAEQRRQAELMPG